MKRRSVCGALMLTLSCSSSVSDRGGLAVRETDGGPDAFGVASGGQRGGGGSSAAGGQGNVASGGVAGALTGGTSGGGLSGSGGAAMNTGGRGAGSGGAPIGTGGRATTDAGSGGAITEAGAGGSREASIPSDASGDGAPTGDAGSIYDGTIYAIQRPGSAISPGDHVVIDNAAIRVTGVFTTVFFMQEAESEFGPACDWPSDYVFYRGITVEPLAFDPTLPLGQRVRVEGDVAEQNGNTTIVNAVVTRIGTPATPYEPVCLRYGARYDERLEGILMTVAGAAVQPDQGDEGKPWKIDPCQDHVLVTIGNDMYPFLNWTGFWTSATGILVQHGSEYRIEPRGPDDVIQGNGGGGSDVCL